MTKLRAQAPAFRPGSRQQLTIKLRLRDELPMANRAGCPRGSRRAMPAASQRRHVGHGAVMFAVGPLGNRTAAEVKIRVPRIAARPAANLWGERADLFGGSQAWVGVGGCLARAKADCSGTGSPRRGAGGPGLALPFVRTGIGTAACSTWATVTVPAAKRRSTMPTPQGTRRSPSCQRLTLLGPTPNSRATRCCAMPSAPSVSRNSVVATGESPAST